MKLHENQLKLIKHLIRFNLLDYQDCLKLLDTENTGDNVALSYAFRPLTKNNYISKNKNGCVSILAKGRALFPKIKPLISTGGGEREKKRIMQISRMAMFMESNGIPVKNEIIDCGDTYFIPSPCWRKIATGILSTTRFIGMLINDDKKYAVYDIGDGRMDWQVRAESSLFYTRFSSYETSADGMIMICDEEKRMTVAENIIRQTMWNRKQLMKSHYAERDRPVKYSHSPIKLRTQYNHVYLTTPSKFYDDLYEIINEEYNMFRCCKGNESHEPKQCDMEDWPYRYFFNPAFDLLKFVYFFSAVKSVLDLEKEDIPVSVDVKYRIILPKSDFKILKLYPDVLLSERTEVYEYRPNEND